MRPKQSKKRKRILEAAIEVLADQGFQYTKIRDIAQRAGVADGTIYLYFKNKDELLIELFEDVMKRVFSLFDQALHEKKYAKEKLTAFLYAHLKMVEYEPAIAQIISVVLRQSSSFITDYQNHLFSQYLTYIQDILLLGIEEGTFRKDLPTSIASRAIFGAVDELALAWLLSKRKEDSLEEAAQTVAELLLHGLLQKEKA